MNKHKIDHYKDEVNIVKKIILICRYIINSQMKFGKMDKDGLNLHLKTQFSMNIKCFYWGRDFKSLNRLQTWSKYVKKIKIKI